jgi:hypothetical protein
MRLHASESFLLITLTQIILLIRHWHLTDHNHFKLILHCLKSGISQLRRGTTHEMLSSKLLFLFWLKRFHNFQGTQQTLLSSLARLGKASLKFLLERKAAVMRLSSFADAPQRRIRYAAAMHFAASAAGM